MNKHLFIFLILTGLCITNLDALELPFFIEFRSANEFIHYPQRQDRKYNWDDNYRIRFGIDSLEVGEFSTVLILKSSDNFIKQQVLLDRAELTYHMQMHQFGISSKTLGYGNDYRSNNTYHNDAGFGMPLYKAFRYNGFKYRYGRNEENLSFSLGAMDFDSGTMALEAHKTISSNAMSIQSGIKTELRIKDNFHSRPLALYSANLSLQHKYIDLKADGVLTHYLHYNNNQSMLKLFQVAEITFHPLLTTDIYLSNQYETRAIYPLEKQEYKAGLVQRAGRFSLNPEYEYQQLDQDTMQRFNLLLTYHLHRDIQVAFYFRHSDIQSSELNNVYGIQAHLRRSF